MKLKNIVSNLFIYFSLIIIITSCQFYKEGTFIADVEKLKSIDGLEVLFSDNAMIAVSGPYQGRVFTSSLNGWNGRSLGYINWELIESGTHENQIAGLGGESRIWFAPDFGKYSVFFEPGTEQNGENVRPPKDLNSVKFSEIEKDEHSITFGGKLSVLNATGFTYKMSLERRIAILTKEQIESSLNVSLENIDYVAFSANTKLTNIGKLWKKETGLTALWELGCMQTSDDTMVIIPLTQQTTDISTYFTETTKERMQVKDAVVYYKADALGMNKIGVKPQYSKNVMGSYSPKNKQLNIVTFNFENKHYYLNALPNNTTPYKGDVTNIFNGEVNPELDYNWPFYEFESASFTKELDTDEQLYHQQTTHHFVGEFDAINTISKKVLGVDLNAIPQF